MYGCNLPVGVECSELLSSVVALCHVSLLLTDRLDELTSLAIFAAASSKEREKSKNKEKARKRIHN